jgi:hypothetical protein
MTDDWPGRLIFRPRTTLGKFFEVEQFRQVLGSQGLVFNDNGSDPDPHHHGSGPSSFENVPVGPFASRSARAGLNKPTKDDSISRVCRKNPGHQRLQSSRMMRSIDQLRSASFDLNLLIAFDAVTDSESFS